MVEFHHFSHKHSEQKYTRLLSLQDTMLPLHHSLIPPSLIRHNRPDFENVLDHPNEFVSRTTPCRTDLDDESLLLNQVDKKDDQGQLLCCACHKPLELTGVPNKTLCYVCNKAPSAYICAPCPNELINFFDRRCAELPKEIHYPYHPHPLSMRIRKNSTCCVCRESCKAFNYGCDGCGFTVDIKCTIREIKKYEGPLSSMRRFMGLVQDL